MSNPWFRMYAEFATDPKVQMMSEANQRRLTMLFCFRCNGDVTLHDDEVTFLLRVTSEEWQVTKALFIEKGFIDKHNNLLNWDKRQFASDSSKNRVAAYRERKKNQSNNDVTLYVTKSNAIDTEQIQNRTDTEQSKSIGEKTSPIAKQKKQNGTRISDSWTLSKKNGEWALSVKPHWTPEKIRTEASAFKDYWLAKAGSDGVKNDWDATWRNWVRRSNDVPMAGQTGGGYVSVNKQAALEQRNAEAARQALEMM